MKLRALPALLAAALLSSWGSAASATANPATQEAPTLAPIPYMVEADGNYFGTIYLIITELNDVCPWIVDPATARADAGMSPDEPITFETVHNWYLTAAYDMNALFSVPNWQNIMHDEGMAMLAPCHADVHAYFSDPGNRIPNARY